MGTKDFPFQFDLEAIRGEMEEMFRKFLSLKGSFFMVPGHVWNPPTDIFETEEEIVVLLEIAGVKKTDIQVSFKGVPTASVTFPCSVPFPVVGSLFMMVIVVVVA